MGADERLAAEISAFLGGQLEFSRLVGNLGFIIDGEDDPSTGDTGAADALDALLERCVTMRRLPPDLVAAIREAVLSSRRAQAPLPANGPDLLDSIPSTGPSDLEAAADYVSHDGFAEDDQPTVRLTSPDTGDAGSIDDRVDEVVLSALVDDFRGYRDQKGTGQAPAGSRPDRATDALLSGFTGARARRDAERASEGRNNPARRENRRKALKAQSDVKAPGIGSMLKERFVLDEELGTGGMGTVYKAVDLRRLEAAHADPYVAIKVLSREFARDFRAFQTLEAEARKSQMLSHPNIVHIHDFDRDGGHAFLVMELLKGKDLATVLMDRGPLSFELATRVFGGVFEALAYAHARNVIHCDIKPGNIFLPENGQVKVLDFGIAVANGLSGFDVSELGSYTSAYASPDVLKGRPQTISDDIYALGCTIYQALSGQHPFSNRSAVDAIELGLQPARIKDLPAASWTALKKSLAFDRTERFETMEAFRNAFFRRSILGRVFGASGPTAA